MMLEGGMGVIQGPWRVRFANSPNGGADCRRDQDACATASVWYAELSGVGDAMRAPHHVVVVGAANRGSRMSLEMERKLAS